MDAKSSQDQRVDVNFESHPPIEDDLDGISTLIRQTLLQFPDCNSLARYLIQLKDVTQVIALEASEEEENTSDDDDDEPDNDIYGVSSVIELPIRDKPSDTNELDARKQLLKFLKDKSKELRESLDKVKDDKMKIGMVVNERYINLPPQLALPTLKNLTQYLDESHYTHLVFVAKILLKARGSDTKLPSKKTKSAQSSAQSGDAEPLVFVNPEEEIICEGSECYTDVDVSSYCDENATWSFSSDVKYIPHRRTMLVDYKNWPKIMKDLEKELN